MGLDRLGTLGRDGGELGESHLFVAEQDWQRRNHWAPWRALSGGGVIVGTGSARLESA